MRWIYFLILVWAAVILQTSVIQALWLPTSLGYVGPEMLACVAVFVSLRARRGTDAALAGWVLGFALDLTLSGRGVGLLALLYAAACAGIFSIREAFFSDRPMTQMILALVFCLFVYELWTAYDALTGEIGTGWWRAAVQAAGVAAYTAVLTPLVCGLLSRMQRLLILMPLRRWRR
jgi:rod shape-determining protein MreD